MPIIRLPPQFPLASRSHPTYVSTPVSEAAKESEPLPVCPRGFVCPLNKVQPGTMCRIHQLLASPELSKRLREMGFCEDQKIRLVSQQANMICQVCNARLAISEQLAEAILVEPMPGIRRAS